MGPDRWNRLVTDERAELIRELRRLAAAHGLRPAVRAYRADGLAITPRPVVPTSHPAYGYLIGVSGTRTARAPEFLEFPSWAAGVDLTFAEAAGHPPPARSLCTHSNKCMPIIYTGTRCMLASPGGRGEPTSGPA